MGLLNKNKKKIKSRKCVWIVFLSSYLGVFIACILVIHLNIKNFDSIDWNPGQNRSSLCKEKCYQKPMFDHYSFNEFYNLSTTSGILLHLGISILRFPFKQFIYVNYMLIFSSKNSKKILLIRFFCTLIVLLIYYFFTCLLQSYLKNWALCLAFFIVGIIYSITISFFLPFFLTKFKCDIPSDLFLTTFHLNLNCFQRLKVFLFFNLQIKTSEKTLILLQNNHNLILEKNKYAM